MDKSYIEKRIEAKAQERLRVEYREVLNFVTSNKILASLFIKVADQEKKEMNIKQANNEYYSILNTDLEKSLNEDNTICNIKEVLTERKKVLVREETDNLLEKLNSVRYLFEQ